MKLVVFSRDLMLASSLEGAARKVGLELSTCSAQEAAVSAAMEEDCRFLLLDLGVPGLELSQLVQEIRAATDQVQIIAFGPHVHEQRLTEAEQAGCDQVVTRGQLHREAEAIFATG